MQTHKITLTPKSAFGTALKGDTLFGQLCWAIRNRFGEKRLNDLLVNYTDGQPFVVMSDALPAEFLPRPSLPTNWFDEVTGADRKAVKKRAWMPLSAFYHPVAEWLEHCQSAANIPGGAALERPQPHNTINRATNTTGNGFDPYSIEQRWYGNPKRDKQEARPPLLDLIIVLNECRLAADELKTLLEDIGALGFGRDASIGLGKFEITNFAVFKLPSQPNADAWLTLAPCAPQGLAWDQPRCFYQPFTRFGRHGDIGVHLGNPFKTPVLLADTGAVLTPRMASETAGTLFTGQGLGGDGSLSKSLPQTVHQGYAPVVGINLPKAGPQETA